MGDATNGAAEAERFAIGISFGNSCSSIARISPVSSDIDLLRCITVTDIFIGGQG